MNMYKMATRFKTRAAWAVRSCLLLVRHTGDNNILLYTRHVVASTTDQSSFNTSYTSSPAHAPPTFKLACPPGAPRDQPNHGQHSVAILHKVGRGSKSNPIK